MVPDETYVSQESQLFSETMKIGFVLRTAKKVNKFDYDFAANKPYQSLLLGIK